MEEMIDVLDGETGKITGEVISKKEAHKRGIWHSSIHILIVNKDCTKTLLQKRCERKDLYPNMWDIAVGGHISAGEDPISSAKRELEEELGLDSSKYDFQVFEVVKEMFHDHDVISNEFVSCFVIYDDIDIRSIQLQEEEVSEAKWCTKKELNEFIRNNQMIPHHREYEILNEILKDTF